MIKVDKLYEDFDDTLPVSVIVPLSNKRKDFFYKMVYPLLEANRPAEIIVNDNEGTAPKKRNDGFDKSTQKYVYFLDDDILLPSDHIKKLYDELTKQQFRSDRKIGFTYSGYYGIVLHPESHPMKGNFNIPTIEYNSNMLKMGNYISTMSLIYRDIFPRFDESLKRLQDWDIWLSLLSKGIEGKAVFNNEFYAYYLDQGITSNNNNEIDAIIAIRKKHNL